MTKVNPKLLSRRMSVDTEKLILKSVSTVFELRIREETEATPGLGKVKVMLFGFKSMMFPKLSVVLTTKYSVSVAFDYGFQMSLITILKELSFTGKPDANEELSIVNV